MEESKDLQSIYKIFRTFIYLSLVIEFFEYAITPGMLTFWGGIVADIHGRMKLMDIYQDGHLLHSKIMTLLIICVTCIGTRNKKHLEFNAKRMVIYPLSFGLMLMFLSVWMFYRGWQPFFFSLPCSTWLYFLMSVVGTVLCHVALDNISKYLKDGLLKDRFNLENESFLQNDKKIENKYSVNIPMRYYYKGKFRKGWVNIVNPFRGTWVVGTPGSGKTFSIIEPFIRQHSAKGFAVVAYDYKFPTLAQKLYYHYRINKKAGRTPKGCDFNIINFVNVEYSRRVNPIQLKYIGNLAAASETAETLLESLQKGKKEGGGGSDQFFQTSAVNFLAACIYFFCNYQKRPYDEHGRELAYDKTIDPETGMIKPTGVVRDAGGNVCEPAYWLGKYSDMPHILSFLNESYETIFEVLMTDTEVAPLLGPFRTAFENKAMEQLELAYMDARDDANINQLLLIPCVILDFLCIHPFRDGNGRMSRLLSLLLLYKNGYDAGKYVSFEEQINKYKAFYYEALRQSSDGWAENQNTYFPFIENFLSTLYMCYKELDKRFAVVHGKKITKKARIEATVLNSLTPLSKAEICQILPDVSPTTVEAVLGAMVKDGSIKRIGSARASRYIKAN